MFLIVPLGVLTPACADPSQTFDDFVARDKPLQPSGECPDAYLSPAPGAMDGPYLMGLLTTVNEKPLVLRADVTTESLDGGLGLGMNLQPLDKMDWFTPRGESKLVPPVPVATNGEFTMDLQGLRLEAEANCVTGGATTADVVFTGYVCGDGTFVCGTLKATKPIPFQGTFTLQHIMDEMSYPPPQLDCMKTEYMGPDCGPQ